MALDANGWTIIPTAGGRTIFCSSSSGSNSNSGLSEGLPKQTLQPAMDLLRSDQPDWLFLKSGDTFDIAGSVRLNSSGGPNANAMSVITAYGTGPRPILNKDRVWHGSGVSGIKHFAVTDVDFYNSLNDPLHGDFVGNDDNGGFDILEQAQTSANNSTNILIEGCRFRYCDTGCHIYGFDPTGMVTNVTVRRNVFDENLRFGMLNNYTSGVLYEDNIFGWNGWYAREDTFQGLYLTGCDNVRLTGNLMHRAGNMSVKLSSNYLESVHDVLYEDNVFNRGMLGFGHADYFPERWNPNTEFSHRDFTMRRCVMLQTVKDLPVGGSNQSFGLNIGNMKNGLWENNCFIHNDDALAGGRIFNFAQYNVDPFPRSLNITARNNYVHNWLSSHFNATGQYYDQEEGCTNFVQVNNCAVIAPESFPDPTRDLGKYNAYRGGADDEDALVNVSREMYRGNWDVQYTGGPISRWIRRGFMASPRYMTVSAGGATFAIQAGE